MGEVRIPVNTGDLPVFVAVPEQGAPWPGVVVLHDFAGMSEDLRNQIRWLAREGFLAAAPNLYFRGARMWLVCTSGHGRRPTGRSFLMITSINFVPKIEHKNMIFASLDPLKPQTMVAVEEGLIHGFATTGPARELDPPDHGELFALYVDPEQWGRGIGMALVAAARTRLSDSDFEMRFCGS